MIGKAVFSGWRRRILPALEHGDAETIGSGVTYGGGLMNF